MQRRAAAIYAAFFILIAAGAYAMIGVAQEPTVSIQNPDHTLVSGDQVTIDGRTYTATVTGGSADLAWVNESARYTESWEAQSRTLDARPGQGGDGGAGLGLLADEDVPTVEYQNTTYRVIVRETPGEPTSFFLVESRSLPEDVTTTTVNGTLYVALEDDGGREFRPAETYMRDRFGPPAVRSYAEGDTLPYQDETASVASVTNTSVTLEWTAPRENTITASEGANVTLNGRQFVAHFPNENTLELSRNLAGYQRQLRTIDTYEERVNGLWGVSILSGLTAITLIGLAYLPSRY